MFVFPSPLVRDLLLVLFVDDPCNLYGCHNFPCLVNKTSPVCAIGRDADYFHKTTVTPTSRTVPDRPGLNFCRSGVRSVPGPWLSGTVRDGPGWSGMVRDTTTEVLKCLKLPGSSVTVRDESLVRGSPGRSV